MQTLRGLSLALALAASLGLVFYNGASRRWEIGMFVALFTALVLFGSFTKARRPRDYAPTKRLDARQVMCWLFAFTAVEYAVVPRLSVLYAVHQHYALLPLRNLGTIILYAIVPIANAIAWWTIWKRKPTARMWGIAASTTYLLVFLRPIIFYPGSAWWHYWNVLLVGIVGLVVFLPSVEQTERPAPSSVVST